MDATRIKSTRGANRAAVTRYFKKLEDLNNQPEFDIELAGPIIEAIEKKQSVIQKLDGEIIDNAADEDINTEMTDADEYDLDLVINLRRYKKLIQNSKDASQNRTANNTNAHQYIRTQDSHQENTHEQQSSSYVEPMQNHVDTHDSRQVPSDFDRSYSHTGSSSTQNHRLPKLSLPNFSGDVLQWQYFWDNFETTVHNNNTLTAVQKFSYLQSLLQAEAMNVINGLTLSNDNYNKAIDLLTRRYGQKHKVVNAYMKALLELPAPFNTLESLRNFLDTTESYIRGLESLGQPQEMYGSMLIPIILGKLPVDVKRSITKENKSDDWTLDKLRTALQQEISIEEAINDDSCTRDQAKPTASFHTGISKRNRNNNANHRRNNNEHNGNGKTTSCIFCKENHSPTECKKVVDNKERWNIVKKKNACFNCLGNHRSSDCQSKHRCRKCKNKHHTSLCNDSTNQPVQETTRESETSVFCTSAIQQNSTVFLKTAVAPVWFKTQSDDANILFDEGAQRSFITQELADKIGAKHEGKETLNIAAFGASETSVRHVHYTTVYLEGDSGEKIPLSVVIVPTIAAPIQDNRHLITQKMSYLKGLKLAHPLSEHENFEISLLIGADHYWDIVKDKVIRGNGPTAVDSRIGYLLSGSLNTGKRQGSSHMMHILANHVEENHDIERFWKLESLGIQNDEKLSTVKQTIKEYASKSITYEDGKYVANLPWIEDSAELPTNENITRKRTEKVIERLSRESKLMKIYGDIINDQERRGFIERVRETETEEPKRIHYIPHHPVSKDSTTTPIRIVNTQHLTTDIEKAFLQVGLHKSDRDVTRFYWLSDPTDANSPWLTYRFKSVLFGATCSPFILNATLIKHFSDNPSQTATRLEQDLYVDNVLTSFRDENELTKFYSDARCLLQKGGFNLRSWNSNSEKLRHLASNDSVLDSDKNIKILGMKWNVQGDELLFPKLDIDTNMKQATKREILRQSVKIFDPLGILSPVTVRAKTLMQSLWKRNLGWDEILPEDVMEKWTNLAMDLTEATHISIPRLFNDGVSQGDALSLHVFMDSSQQAYGACVYLTNGTNSQLVMAKNRVAPIKSITLPRLELMGALVGAKLAKHVSVILGISNLTFWCDSQIVLSWLNSSKVLKPFIARRVTEIRELVGTTTWRYCPTDQNPADLLTRGISASKLKTSTLWFNGPEWILHEKDWPTWDRNSVLVATVSDDTQDEDTPTENVKSNLEVVMNLERTNSYQKTLRIMGYVLRFIDNCKSEKANRSTGILSVSEIQNASLTLIRNVQQIVFKREYMNIMSNDANRLPIVRQLRLFVDEKGLLRSGGRIDNAAVSETVKYPYLLPTKHSLTRLIIMDSHKRQAHAGLNGTITHVQQTFWIPKIRQQVKNVLRSCIPCRKILSRPYNAPDPPPLPKDRLGEDPPFSVTGVDFTGAMYLRNRDKTDTNESKVYLCLFTCASTRAVHIEIVRDLTEHSFILAFRRFSSRRSVPHTMISDNATTYKSASTEITRLSNSEVVHGKLREHGTVWKFIPNRAPWYGGWWERLIGLTKNSLKKTLGRVLIDFDTLQTIVTEIECTLNNRPLTYISTDDKDPEPLTPSHLLYGRTLKTLPYPSQEHFDNVTKNLTRSNAVKLTLRQRVLIQHFQTRWKREYVTALREFHRTHGDNRERIRVGDVVQIHEDSSRTLWNVGVVQDLVRGGDGMVRSANVRTKFGVTNRPIVKLYPLEINAATSDDPPALRRSERLKMQKSGNQRL